MSLHGMLIRVHALADRLKLAMDAGARRVMIWIAVPVCQFATLSLGRRRDTPPGKPGTMAAPASE